MASDSSSITKINKSVILNRLTEALDRIEGEEVFIHDCGHYWSIPPEVLFNVHTDLMKVIGIGDFEQDMHGLLDCSCQDIKGDIFDLPDIGVVLNAIYINYVGQ